MSTNQESCECTEKLDPRVVRTRNAIQSALKELLLERRFEEITVQDITERAGVNRATFYAHFQDKYDLLEGSLATDLRKRLFAALQPEMAFSRENIKIFSTTLFEFLRDVNSGCARRREFGPLLETTIQGTIFEFIKHWIEKKPGSSVTKGQPADVVATIYSWALFGAGIRWVRMETRPPVDRFADEVLGVLAA